MQHASLKKIHHQSLRFELLVYAMNAALRDLLFISSIVTPGDAMHLLKRVISQIVSARLKPNMKDDYDI